MPVIFLYRSSSLEEERLKNSELNSELANVLDLLARSANKHDFEKERASHAQLKYQAIQQVYIYTYVHNYTHIIIYIYTNYIG